MTTMTLEMALSAIDRSIRALREAGYTEQAAELTEARAPISRQFAHIAKPAQAVDVGAIREVIDGLHKEIGESDKNSRIRVATVRTYLKKLNRAIGNAQAEGSNGTG